MCFFWLEWWDLKVTLWRKVYVVHILEQNLYCFCSFEEISTLIFESEENVCLASAFSQKWAQSICLLSSFQKLVKQNIIPHISQTLDTVCTLLVCLIWKIYHHIWNLNFLSVNWNESHQNAPNHLKVFKTELENSVIFVVAFYLMCENWQAVLEICVTPIPTMQLQGDTLRRFSWMQNAPL